jgi:hypothetical protein
LPARAEGKLGDVLEVEERGDARRRLVLPDAAGPISTELLDLLARPLDAEAEEAALGCAARVGRLAGAVAEPLSDDDLQLALYVGYELHYRGFPGCDAAWEWSPGLLSARGTLERAFFAALEVAVPRELVDPAEVGDLLFRIEAEDEGASLSRQLEREPDLGRFREFVVHRSLYQLKEADPHSWAVPRLRGAAKTALLEVQGDEYGGGRPERIHSTLFAKTMRALGLDDRENAYLDRIPGVTLATVNLMSGTGLRRDRRGAIVGHLAMFEMTSAQPNRRYGNALRKLGFGEEATDFYDEHVEADAIHENIAAFDLAGGLARSEPQLAADIVFGARALLFLEGRFAGHLIDSWRDGGTSLRRPLRG